VLITAPTGRQANEVVWSEFMRAYHKLNRKIPVGGRLLESGELKYPGHELEDIHNVICFSTDEANALTGFHAANVLIIVSEAQGLNPKLWRAVKSLLTGTGVVRLLLIGNAVPDLGGEFYQSFSKNRSLYKCLTLDSRNSSHCSAEFIADVIEEYGIDSPMFQMMVAGDFPKEGQDTLISISDIEKNQDAFRVARPGPTSAIGVDVGDQGSDETVFYEKRGERFLNTHAAQGDDTEVTGAKLKKRIEDTNVSPRSVNVDSTGIGNAVVSYCKHRKLPVNGVNFSATPKGAGAKKYKNKRAEMFFHLAKEMKKGAIPIDPEDTRLAQELSVLRYKVNGADGTLQMVKKEDIKKLLGRSPDRADGLALCAYGKPHARPRLTSGAGKVKEKGKRGPSHSDYREQARDRIKGNRRRLR